MVFNLLILIFIPVILINGWNIFLENADDSIMVKVLKDKRVTKLPLEEYVKGVVAAEMPAEFELEALKAQAVAARTYILRELQGSKDRTVEITADIDFDQAWLTKKDIMDDWSGFKNWIKIAKAVDSTKGIFLTYNGKVISAVYHSASGKMTAAASNVWGKNFSYLRPVKSPYEVDSPYNRYVQKFSFQQFAEKLGLSSTLVRNNLANKIHILARSKSNRVLKVKVGQHVLTGKELRKQLGLKSTNFRCQVENGYIKFITSGNGHGVGMSQYGANGMAQEGYDYLEILQHYYPGVEVKKLSY